MRDREKLLEELRERLRETGAGKDEEIRAAIRDLVRRERETHYLSIRERGALERELFASVRGLDILEPLLADTSVSEIMVNGPDQIYIEKNGTVIKWPAAFASKEKLEDIIQQIVGSCDRVINERQPIADARLPDGSRVNAVIAPVALDGPVLTIRRFPDDPITMEKLIEYGSVTNDAADFLRKHVQAGYSILISGGTSAGKTTFLNALARFVPSDERIVTIEDNAELQIRGIPNLVRLEAKAANMEGNRAVTIRDLIRTALRMRPDRLIVGEVRGEEAAELLQALNTGHQGSLSTIHANSAADTMPRLETLTLMALDIPLRAVRAQIRSAIDLVVYLGRLPDRSRRVLEIAEIQKDREPSSDDVALHPLYAWDDDRKTLKKIDDPANTEKLVRAGLLEAEEHPGLHSEAGPHSKEDLLLKEKETAL